MICKGTGKAKGSGCGNPTEERRYGLGVECCFKLWLISTDNGFIEIKAIAERASKKVARDIKRKQIKKRQEDARLKAKMRIDIMSVMEYKNKILQPNINLIARLIDYGQPCISTNNLKGKMSGGHYVGAGKNITISFNLHNIFIQSFHSNHHNSGDILNYQDGLINTFGTKYFNFVQSLRKCEKIDFNKEDLIRANKKCRLVIKELNAHIEVREPKERIRLRNKVNDFLDFYPEEYSKY